MTFETYRPIHEREERDPFPHPTLLLVKLTAFAKAFDAWIECLDEYDEITYSEMIKARERIDYVLHH